MTQRSDLHDLVGKNLKPQNRFKMYKPLRKDGVNDECNPKRFIRKEDLKTSGVILECSQFFFPITDSTFIKYYSKYIVKYLLQ